MHLHYLSTSSDTGAPAPFPPPAVLLPPGWSPDRDVRIAGALRIRTGIILDEMAAAVRLGEATADPVMSYAYLGEFNELWSAQHRLSQALADLEDRIEGGRA